MKSFNIAILLTLLTANTLHADQQPNFVFIIADDCTFRDIGCYGGQAYTPNIDQLATEGMKFNQCFQAAPMCSPTRHNIYTGQYPVKTGAYPNHTYARDDVQSICHHLKPLGYRVALSGKTHISPKTVFPFEYSQVKDKGTNPDMQAIDQLFAECQKSDTPFCLFACSNEPHAPFNQGDPSRYPPEKIVLPPYLVDTPVLREEFSRYLAEITYYDGQVGQILDMLDQHQLNKNTMVMVVSEQGNQFPFAKWTCYDAGLQSIMIVRWPGQVKAGSETNAMVEYGDVTPTFVDAAGLPAYSQFDGKSFLPVLRGETNKHQSHVYGIMTTRGIINGSDCFPIRSVRDKRYHLIWNLNHEATFTNACTKSDVFQSMITKAESGDQQAIELVKNYQHRPEFEFYDTQADPMEMTNLINKASHAQRIEKLKARLQTWMKEQGDEGVDTELAANEHQNRGKKKKKAKSTKPNSSN